MRIFYKHIKNLIAPSFCVYCKQWLFEPLILCERCKDLIKPVVSTKLSLTPTISMKVFAISSYQEPLKSLILAKAQSQRLASKHLGNLIWTLTPIKNISFDYVVPIPLHWTRYAYRGYNQSEVIGAVIAQKSGKPLINLLKRNRRTLFQSQLNVEQRSDNVHNAFDLLKVDSEIYKNKHLLLVDDLLTTGSTLKNAAKKLLVLKPATITAVVSCRTV